MIKALNLLLHGVPVATALLSANCGIVFVQASKINVKVQEAATSAFVVYPWDNEHRALGSKSCWEDDPMTFPDCFSDKSCCMLGNYNIYKDMKDTALSCTSQAVKFICVDSIKVFDPESQKCNCKCTGCPACNSSLVSCQLGDKTFPSGTEIGACRGIDDVVSLQFELTIEVQVEYDIGLYINTVGGNGA